MKKVILGILLVIGLVSCDSKVIYDGKTFSNYSMYVDYSINTLKHPVILIGIDKYVGQRETYYGILVKDSNNVIKYYNSNSNLANIVGETYKLRDTIR